MNEKLYIKISKMQLAHTHIKRICYIIIFKSQSEKGKGCYNQTAELSRNYSEVYKAKFQADVMFQNLE